VAGLIARLFGGKPSPAADIEPAPGIGGYHLGRGPAGQTGFPGSTTQVRTFPGRNPTRLGTGDWTTIKAETNYGFDQAPGTAPEVRQASYRGSMGRGGGQGNHPRQTPPVIVPQTAMRQKMQHNDPSEFFGGPALHTRQGNNTAGGNPLTPAQAAGGHSQRDTTTPWTRAQPQVGGHAPGSANVRNTYAQRYKNRPGEIHAYLSAPRADQAPVNPGGQATDGNVKPSAVVQPVAVPSRRFDDGVISWSVLREMPYGGRGDGARGADLNGQRYYAAGQAGQFMNGGMGGYGTARQLGSKRPVGFTQPAPWTANYYDTTASVGTTDNPNASPAHQPDAVYYSPGGLRASNSTGRTG
jgi:hypothetical protein